MDKTYIINLLHRYFTNQASHAEREALFTEVEKYKNNTEWEELLMNVLPMVEVDQAYDPVRYESMINAVLNTGHDGHNGRELGIRNKELEGKVRRMWKWVAAAAIIIVIAAIAYLSTVGVPASPVGVHANDNHDIAAPSNTRAVITLANGTKVYLDSSGNGTIAQQDNVSVIKNADGTIKYNREDAKTQGTIAYNTLSNPRGSKVISLTLSDGTRVWLNSESSLKYPAAFNGNTREVEITGEAYFEVKHNAKQPFKVHLPNGSTVEDIGTAFNVNAYGDESDLKTTLIEGSIRLSSSRPGVLAVKLKPGEQGVLNQVNPKISRIEVQAADVEQVTAWKNGRFDFDNAGLQQIMKQIARWYDLDVVYEGTIPNEPFRGEISRNVPVSKVLQMLEYLGVKFKMEGKKIIVMKEMPQRHQDTK